MGEEFKAHWVPDQQVAHCKGCSSRFDTTNRKHHCRLCGDIFCDRCSFRKINMKEFNLSGARSCDPCYKYCCTFLPMLMRETSFVRFERDKQKNQVFVRISDDRRRLTYRYHDDKFASELDFDSFTKIDEGHKTAVWSEHKGGMFSCCMGGEDISKDEMLCFSIGFTSESVDLRADSLQKKTEWLEAFREFIARKSTRGEKAWQNQIHQEHRDQVARAKEERAQKTQRVVNKYSQLKTNLKKKSIPNP